MRNNCELCAESNVGPEHELSEKHIKNCMLKDYSRNKKQFAGNRRGIHVSCSVRSSCMSYVDCVDSKIKISAKPNEEVRFNFKIKNESLSDLHVKFIQLVHSQLKFTLGNREFEFGCRKHIIKAKSTMQKEVFAVFKSADIGQYATPIIFSFCKSGDDSIVVMRDMIVFVESKQAVHAKKTSPYTQKEVKADNVKKTNMKQLGDNLYRIPKNYKQLYARGLKVSDNASEQEKEFCAQIREIFETGVTEDNYVEYFHNLLWYEETIVRINLKKYNMSDVPLSAEGKNYALLVPGLSEKRPSLMLGDLLFVKPSNSDAVLYEAVISDIRENVAIINGFDPSFKECFKRETRFDIRFFMSRLPLERMHQAVSFAAKGRPEQLRVFPQENKLEPAIMPVKKYFNPLVQHNAEQRSVVEHILAGSSGIAPYLLHGPPGTGKTVTIVEAILQLVNKDPMYRIMVCTDSNMAADHVAMLLMTYSHMFEGTWMLRANSRFRVWETMPESLRKHSNGHCRDNFQPISVTDFLSYRIVVTTLSHAAKFARDFKKKQMARPITHLFVDEAAQASEPACMIPTCGLLTTNGALVLAGDPLQLGPVVISHQARRIGLGLSLMERLKNTCPLYSDERSDPHYMVMLRKNFRSHPDILDIPNEIFYKGQLIAEASEDAISKVDILGQKTASRAIVFHGVLSKEQRMGKSPSFFNDMELEIVQTYITALVFKHNVLPDDIGIVAPYIRQVYKIKNWLATQKFGVGKIEVGTVEAFQGKEKRVIIISTVRANCDLLDHDAKFQLGFLVDDKRFNVALTRAKAKAIVIGNPLCLQKDVKWRSFIQRCRQFGTYCGYDAGSEDIQKDIVSAITPLLKEIIINKTKAEAPKRS